MVKILILSFLISLTQNTLARDFGLKAMAHTNGAVMATPPLPILFAQRGMSQISLKPAKFSANNFENKDLVTRQAEFEGSGLAFLYSHRFSNSWGYFFLLNGVQVEGQFSSPGSNPTDLNEAILMKDVNSTMMQGSIGLSLNLIQNSWLGLQIFAGPSVVNTQLSQKVIQNDSQPDDFDMSLNPTTLHYLAGAQLGLRFSRYFELNPYVVVSNFANKEDKCQEFDSVVRVKGELFDLSDTECQDGQNSSTSKVVYDTGFTSFGVNLNFPSIGFGINAYAETGEIEYFNDIELEFYSLSFNFVF